MRARPGGGSALRQWPLCPACWSRTPRSAPALPRCFNSPQSRMHLCVSIPYTWTVPLRPVACQNFGVFKHMQAAEHPWLQQAGQSAQTRSRGPSVDRSVLQRLQVLRCFCELLTSNGHRCWFACPAVKAERRVCSAQRFAQEDYFRRSILEHIAADIAGAAHAASQIRRRA